MPRSAVSGLIATARIGIAKTPQPRPSASPVQGSIRPAGIGRCRVRSIRASVSRSIQLLRTFAEATSSPVPASSSAVRAAPIDPGASHTPIAVVKTTMVVTRGFASWTASFTVATARSHEGRTAASIGRVVDSGGATKGESSSPRASSLLEVLGPKDGQRSSAPAVLRQAGLDGEVLEERLPRPPLLRRHLGEEDRPPLPGDEVNAVD